MIKFSRSLSPNILPNDLHYTAPNDLHLYCGYCIKNGNSIIDLLYIIVGMLYVKEFLIKTNLPVN